MATFKISTDGKTMDILGLEIDKNPDSSTSGKTFNVVQFNGKTGVKVQGNGVLRAMAGQNWQDGTKQPFDGELTCNCNAYVKNTAFVKDAKS